MGYPFVQIDAFADRPFAGNPAAVLILERPASESWLQAVAAEMNLAETAFLVPEGDGHRLRWFTPTVEMDLCGHATLAAAHALWEGGYLPAESTARFHTRSGLLTAERRGDWIELDFPAEPVEPVEAPAGLAEALGAGVVWFGRNRLDYLADVGDAAAVRGLRPDLAWVATLPARGLIVTARSDRSEHDFVSRFFAPAAGIAEDPVTGSAHCALGPYWRERLGRDGLTGYQASARGGLVRVRVAGDRVRLAGRAITVLRGEVLVGPAGIGSAGPPAELDQ